MNGQCTNNEGGYECTCNLGFDVSPDKKECRGKSVTAGNIDLTP